MQAGMNIDSRTLIQVLENKVAQAAVREAQMEAGIQALLSEKHALYEQVIDLEQKLNPSEETPHASAGE